MSDAQRQNPEKRRREDNPIEAVPSVNAEEREEFPSRCEPGAYDGSYVRHGRLKDEDALPARMVLEASSLPFHSEKPPAFTLLKWGQR
jgi:hypothetical protein